VSTDASLLTARKMRGEKVFQVTPFKPTIMPKKDGRPITNFKLDMGRKSSPPFVDASPKTWSIRTIWVRRIPTKPHDSIFSTNHSSP